MRLPYGPQFSRVVLSDHQGIRASGDDLSDYFYALIDSESIRPRRAIGPPFNGKGYEAWGGKDGQLFCLVLVVLGMGGQNSPDLAQEVHEQILKDAGCLLESESLRLGMPFPLTSIREGAYYDDHLVSAVLPRAELCRPEGRDLGFGEAVGPDGEGEVRRAGLRHRREGVAVRLR